VLSAVPFQLFSVSTFSYGPPHAGGTANAARTGPHNHLLAMKRTVDFILLWCVCMPCFGQEIVRPLVAPTFGKPVVVTAEFVEKPNTHHAKNIVRAPFYLKVVSVNGRVLKEAVVIEYFLEAKGEEAKLERTGVVHKFEAYETLYQPISAGPWLGEMEQGSEFSLKHLLHIRVMKNKG